MNKKAMERSAILNNSTYNDYCYRIKQIATARFKYENLPESWDEDFMESTLYFKGVLGAWKHEDYGNVISEVCISDKLNLYRMPIQCNCYGLDITPRNKYVYNGVNVKDIDPDRKCVVLIKNNPDMWPTFNTIKLFCKRLYQVERTIDVNMNQQKTPLLITCKANKRLSLLNLYEKYSGNEPVIYGTNDLMSDTGINVINTGAPYLIDKLQIQKQAIWNEVLTFLGINNNDVEKKERVIEAETESNNHFISLNLYNAYRCRKHACDQINKYFGLNINVKINYNLFNNNSIVDNPVEKVEGQSHE